MSNKPEQHQPDTPNDGAPYAELRTAYMKSTDVEATIAALRRATEKNLAEAHKPIIKSALNEIAAQYELDCPNLKDTDFDVTHISAEQEDGCTHCSIPLEDPELLRFAIRAAIHFGIKCTEEEYDHVLVNSENLEALKHILKDDDPQKMIRDVFYETMSEHYWTLGNTNDKNVHVGLSLFSRPVNLVVKVKA